MFSYGSGDYSGLLLFSFANNKFSHDAAVVIIQMTDRFIQKKEIERLAECSDKGNPLLLPEREFTGLYIQLCLLYTSPSPRDTR